MGKTRVVHCRLEPYDVYIGRGRDPRTGEPGEWGNPYSHKPSVLAAFRVPTAEDAIRLFERRVRRSPALMARIKRKLRGKVLGCWCKTEVHPDAPCHGDVLARIADED